MATQIITTLIDSINGSTEDVETVTFFHPMTGQKMTIELDAKNRKAMGTHLERMSKYFYAAEIVEEVTPVKATKASADKGELAKIRAWAKDNGFTIGDRGRIKAEIIEAYYKAQAVGTVSDSEAEASVALDGDTQVIDETPETEQVLADVEATDQTETDALLDEVTGDMDAVVLAALAELDAEGSEITLDELRNKVDSTSASE